MYVNTSKISEYGLPSDLSNNTGVISTLIYGTQWDLALKFIEKIIRNIFKIHMNMVMWILRL